MAEKIDELDGIQSPVHSGPFFHEFVIDLTTSKTSEEFDNFMVERKIFAGIPLESEGGHLRRLIGANEFTCRESVEKLLNALYTFMEDA
jgi:glycine cleavage system pyridoxal-binding protein P